MKNNKIKVLTAACLTIGSFLMSTDAKSQDRKLPDGSIVYGDGSRRLPNGTVIYKGGNNGNTYPSTAGGTITLPDGTTVYPDGTRRYPNNDRRNDPRYKENRRWLPPGQAKKIYGGSAKDYAPGQQKKWKGEKHGKGHGHKDHDD